MSLRMSATAPGIRGGPASGARELLVASAKPRRQRMARWLQMGVSPIAVRKRATRRVPLAAGLQHGKPHPTGEMDPGKPCGARRIPRDLRTAAMLRLAQVLHSGSSSVWWCCGGRRHAARGRPGSHQVSARLSDPPGFSRGQVRASLPCGIAETYLGNRAYGVAPRKPSAGETFGVHIGRASLSKGTGLPISGLEQRCHLPCQPRDTWDWQAACQAAYRDAILQPQAARAGCPKVRLEDVVRATGPEWYRLRGCTKARHREFLLVDSAWMPLCVVEVDGPAHEERGRHRADQQEGPDPGRRRCAGPSPACG